MEGATSHGDNLWALFASSRGQGQIRAFSTSGTRQSNKNITLHDDNSSENGIWIYGATMFVGDAADQKLYAYNLESGERDATKEIDITDLPGNR